MFCVPAERHIPHTMTELLVDTQHGAKVHKYRLDTSTVMLLLCTAEPTPKLLCEDYDLNVE
jgi:hypothetical protein